MPVWRSAKQGAEVVVQEHAGRMEFATERTELFGFWVERRNILGIKKMHFAPVGRDL